MPEPIVLSAGDALATIDQERWTCTSLVMRGHDVLGAAGMRVRFPWTGDETARAARLRVAGRTVAIEPDHYPFAVGLQATWALDGEGLRVALEVCNESRSHAPFGVGVRVALAPVAERVELLVPAEEVWTDDLAVPVSAALDYRRPKRVAHDVRERFTRRHFANLQTQLAVLSREREVWLTTSADFREADVDIRPDGSGTLESATCVPDAFARHAAGVQSGLRVLAPGETWRGHALVVVR
jgi:galactose mutarotase-like enzyme